MENADGDDDILDGETVTKEQAGNDAYERQNVAERSEGHNK